MKSATARSRSQEAARQLRKMNKVTHKLCRLYPELAVTIRLQERRYKRSVASAIMISEQAKQ